MLIHGRNLFPLSKIFVGFNHYYVDSAFNVYSTKSGKLAKLLGSTNRGIRYYTLNNESYKAEAIKGNCESYSVKSSFIKETQPSAEPKVSATGNVTSDASRSYAESINDGIKSRGKIIASVINDRLIFGSDPKIHTSIASCKSEIERLAKNNPGIKFVILGIESAVVSGGVTWS